MLQGLAKDAMLKAMVSFLAMGLLSLYLASRWV